MNVLALKFVPHALRVMIVAAEPTRLAALTELVRDLGHFVVPIGGEAAVALADGIAPPDRVPTVGLGVPNEESQGRLPRNASPEQIDAALRAVAAGLQVAIAGESGRSFDALEEGDSRILLTPREIDVLSAVANGLTNKEVARELGISLHTVKFHLESLMRKIGVSSRTEAVSKAMRLRLLQAFRL